MEISRHFLFGSSLIACLALVGCDNDNSACAPDRGCPAGKVGDQCELEPPPCGEYGEEYVCTAEGEWKMTSFGGASCQLDGGNDGGDDDGGTDGGF